jgi:hypothetical protein
MVLGETAEQVRENLIASYLGNAPDEVTLVVP